MDKNLRYGLLGEHLSHSFSKLIHEKMCGYSYELIETPPEKLEGFLAARNFAAINVTIPYKQAVIPYLDFIDDDARKIGAVNTIVNKNGRLCGYNTDFFGLSYMLDRANIDASGKTALLLGNGGTAKTARAVLRSRGAKEIFTAGRTKSDEAITYEEAIEKADRIEIIINTSPVGMYPNNEDVPIGLERFSKLCGVADVIYNPLKTRFLQRADALGVPTAAGLSMLVAQAKKAAELFLDTEIADEKTEQTLDWLYKSRRNIVLIGMPGCGKSRLGRLAARHTEREFIDLDLMIEEEQKATIAEIFSSRGEEYFRALETDAVKRTAAECGQVIATGGGAVKSKENIETLAQNGFIIFIDRPTEALKLGEGRPLSTDEAAVRKLYGERYPLYKAAADAVIKNDCEFTAVVERLFEAIDNR